MKKGIKEPFYSSYPVSVGFICLLFALFKYLMPFVFLQKFLSVCSRLLYVPSLPLPHSMHFFAISTFEHLCFHWCQNQSKKSMTQMQNVVEGNVGENIMQEGKEKQKVFGGEAGEGQAALSKVHSSYFPLLISLVVPPPPSFSLFYWSK